MSSFNELVNDASREFRKFRDRILECKEKEGISFTNDALEQEAAGRIREFWDDQPWYLQMFRKQVMRGLYKLFGKLKDLL